jgi:SecD/SecF fusion protein
LAALSGVLFVVRGKPHWGLDIVGGVQFTYQMVDKDGEPFKKAPDPSYMPRLLLLLQQRAGNSLGVVDASVEAKGLDQIIVRLPGFTNVDQAMATMGSSARIYFYDAKNVVNEKDNFREYDEADHSSTTQNLDVAFVRKADNAKILPGTDAYLEMIKGWGDPIAEGTDLTKAEMESVPGGGYEPLMHFGAGAEEKWKSWSEANNQRGEKIAAVLDNRVISIAPIKDGAVLGDNMVTEGTFTPEYVHSLVDLLNSGALPVDLKPITSTKVDGTIGANALNMIFTAGVIASAALVVFMLVYYVFPGAIAVIALGLYILFTLTALKLIDATFSLPAIAGFVLSVGMAVDANILVFERLKEEMRSGKDLHRALILGFNRALPAIIDSNACTIITALVLLNLGTGAVKGFATTLIMGVAISLFTAVVVTRSLLMFAVDSGLGDHPSWYGLGRQWFGESLEAGAHKKPLQIVNKSGRYFLISALTIVPGIIFACLGGLKGNVEFTGGTQATFALHGAPSTYGQQSRNIVSTLAKSGLPDCSVITGQNGAQGLAYITIPVNKQINETTTGVGQLIAEKAGLQPSDFSEITTVSGTVQKETITNAELGVVLSTILIILYLSVRFGLALGGFKIGMRFAVSAVLALLHDILVVIGLAALMGYLLNWQVSALFISAMLTVIGFSTHDTIVIFDRIRENLRRAAAGEEIGDLINRSITQSVARSINTSMTVVVTLFLLILVGSATPELKLFNLAMLVGIVSGTYSSIFNASPILYLWDVAIGKKHPTNTLLGIAARDRVLVKRTLTQEVPTYQAPDAQATPGYSQVKRRRASDVERSKRVVDDD